MPPGSGVRAHSARPGEDRLPLARLRHRQDHQEEKEESKQIVSFLTGTCQGISQELIFDLIFFLFISASVICDKNVYKAFVE